MASETCTCGDVLDEHVELGGQCVVYGCDCICFESDGNDDDMEDD